MNDDLREMRREHQLACENLRVVVTGQLEALVESAKYLVARVGDQDREILALHALVEKQHVRLQRLENAYDGASAVLAAASPLAARGVDGMAAKVYDPATGSARAFVDGYLYNRAAADRAAEADLAGERRADQLSRFASVDDLAAERHAAWVDGKAATQIAGEPVPETRQEKIARPQGEAGRG